MIPDVPSGPLHAPGLGASLPPLRRQLAEHGAAVVWGLVPDWLPQGWDGRTPPALLDAADRGRLGSARHPAVRARLLASRLLLKEAVAAALGIAADRVSLGTDARGRPLLVGRPDVDISLSHTRGLVLAGLCRGGLIGVDAEPVDRPLAAADTLQRHICTPEERLRLAGLPPGRRGEELLRLWTLKEAYAKAVGSGLRLRFAVHGFAPHPGGPGFDGPRSAGGRWRFSCHTAMARYALAVARRLG